MAQSASQDDALGKVTKNRFEVYLKFKDHEYRGKWPADEEDEYFEVDVGLGSSEAAIEAAKQEADREVAYVETWNYVGEVVEPVREVAYVETWNYVGEVVEPVREDEVRENAKLKDVAAADGPVPHEQVEAEFGGVLARGDSEEDALDSLVEAVSETAN